MGAPISYPFLGLGFVSVTAAGTPQQIATARTVYPSIYVAAYKAKGTANSGANMYICDDSGKVLIIIPKGTDKFITPGQARVVGMIDLSVLYLDADTTADSLLITAQIS
jgi:hypothetical protein